MKKNIEKGKENGNARGWGNNMSSMDLVRANIDYFKGELLLFSKSQGYEN
jgi:hypothetical protein